MKTIFRSKFFRFLLIALAIAVSAKVYCAPHTRRVDIKREFNISEIPGNISNIFDKFMVLKTLVSKELEDLISTDDFYKAIESIESDFFKLVGLDRGTFTPNKTRKVKLDEIKEKLSALPTTISNMFHSIKTLKERAQVEFGDFAEHALVKKALKDLKKELKTFVSIMYLGKSTEEVS